MPTPEPHASSRPALTSLGLYRLPANSDDPAVTNQVRSLDALQRQMRRLSDEAASTANLSWWPDDWTRSGYTRGDHLEQTAEPAVHAVRHLEPLTSEQRERGEYLLAALARTDDLAADLTTDPDLAYTLLTDPDPNPFDRWLTAYTNHRFPHAATVHRPGSPDLHLGFTTAQQAEAACRSLASARTRLPDTVISHGPTPPGATVQPPLPTDPYPLAEAIIAENYHHNGFPDTYARILAQEGHERGRDIWDAALLETVSLEATEEDHTEELNRDLQDAIEAVTRAKNRLPQYAAQPGTTLDTAALTSVIDHLDTAAHSLITTQELTSPETDTGAGL